MVHEKDQEIGLTTMVQRAQFIRTMLQGQLQGKVDGRMSWDKHLRFVSHSLYIRTEFGTRLWVSCEIFGRER
jgi:hypothetical protein